MVHASCSNFGLSRARNGVSSKHSDHIYTLVAVCLAACCRLQRKQSKQHLCAPTDVFVERQHHGFCVAFSPPPPFPRGVGGGRQIGTTCGGTGFKERTRVSGERPIVTASFRQQSIPASCHTSPPI